ncbi:MAG TPA: META domain-containing protein [Flavobacterium sp.]|nr:META domain-containing protein [Flavobacterium sp.]
MKKVFFATVFLGGILASCNSSIPTEANPQSLNGTWELNYIGLTRLEAKDLYPNKKPAITFNTTENKVNGNTGCNSFFGSLKSVDAHKIQFDQLGMTKMFCEGDGEKIFTENLNKVETWSITDKGKTLHLTTKDFDLMRFTKK